MATPPPPFTTDDGMINDVGLSQTTAISAPKLNELYNKLYPVAFSDAVHDQIVKKQQTVDACTHKEQCNYFNEAMPEVKPNCKTPNGGLNIEDAFKVKANCEEAVWRSIVEAGFILLTKKDMLPAKNGSHSNFNISANKSDDPSSTCHTIKDIPEHNFYVMKTFNNKVYHVKKVKWVVTSVKGKKGKKEKKLNNEPGLMGIELGKKIGLFHSPISGNYKAFVVHDTDSVSIFDQLKHPHAPSQTNAVLYFLMLPEYMADSASHKPWKEHTTLTSLPSGIKILWAGKMRSTYPNWSNTSRNTFFSRFRCDMQVTDWIEKKVEQRWTPFDNHGHAGTVIFVKNATKDNNIPKIEADMKKLKASDAGYNEKRQLALQRKRSGDQMQALAIKRLNNYEEFHVSSDKGENPPSDLCARASFNNVKSHAWLITSDLNLCSYALFLGINVLHTHHNDSTNVKTITSFKLVSPITDNFN